MLSVVVSPATTSQFIHSIQFKKKKNYHKLGLHNLNVNLSNVDTIKQKPVEM